MKTPILTAALAALIAFPAAAKDQKRIVIETPNHIRVSLNFPAEVERGEKVFFAAVERAMDEPGVEMHSAFFDEHDNFIAAVDGAKPLQSPWDWSRVTVTMKQGENTIQLVAIEGSIHVLGHWRCFSKNGSAYRVCTSFDRIGVTMIERAAGAYQWELAAFGETPGQIMKQFDKLGK
jgi:fructose-specific component phosphotransferase system IIB-like protein